VDLTGYGGIDGYWQVELTVDSNWDYWPTTAPAPLNFAPQSPASPMISNGLPANPTPKEQSARSDVAFLRNQLQLHGLLWKQNLIWRKFASFCTRRLRLCLFSSLNPRGYYSGTSYSGGSSAIHDLSDVTCQS
jgi:hypothetical protein